MRKRHKKLSVKDALRHSNRLEHEKMRMHEEPMDFATGHKEPGDSTPKTTHRKPLAHQLKSLSKRKRKMES